MPTSIGVARKIALALPDVAEGICHGTPAFYVRRKLICRVREDGETLAIAYPKEERDELIEKTPDVFSVTDHYRNYDYVLLNLLAANQPLLGDLIEGAWRLKAGKKLVAAYDSAPTDRRSLMLRITDRKTVEKHWRFEEQK